MIKRSPIETLKDSVGETIFVAGSVHVRRDHGKLIFIDLRDVSGMVQMVVLPNNKEAHEIAQAVRPEWIIQVEGKVNQRPEKMVKSGELNGAVELEALNITVISKASELIHLPFNLDNPF